MTREITDEEKHVWRNAVKGIRKNAGRKEIVVLPTKPVSMKIKQSDAASTRLDLHGLTLAQAHKATIKFVEEAHDYGYRKVLIICGKSGEIARELPSWLQLLKQVSRFAHPDERLGGSGAYLVFMRK